MSRRAIDVVSKGAEQNQVTGCLNPCHGLAPVNQHELVRLHSGLLTAAGRKSPLLRLHDLYALFGVGAGLSPYTALKRPQEWVDKVARLFQRSQRWTIA